MKKNLSHGINTIVREVAKIKMSRERKIIEDLEMRLEASLAREQLCDEKVSGLEERISIMQEDGSVEDLGVTGIVKSQRTLITQLRETVVQLNSVNKHHQTLLDGISSDLLNQNSYQDILQIRFGIVSGSA